MLAIFRLQICGSVEELSLTEKKVKKREYSNYCYLARITSSFFFNFLSLFDLKDNNNNSNKKKVLLLNNFKWLI